VTCNGARQGWKLITAPLDGKFVDGKFNRHENHPESEKPTVSSEKYSPIPGNATESDRF
jgi:hypothetical protein